uniref:U18-Hypotoxin-Hsp1a_1 n=1 Tax=Hypochilus sp. SGP-2016 TaxID=1905178 RepID=A0A482ZBP9_9ARAC
MRGFLVLLFVACGMASTLAQQCNNNQSCTNTECCLQGLGPATCQERPVLGALCTPATEIDGVYGGGCPCQFGSVCKRIPSTFPKYLCAVEYTTSTDAGPMTTI